MDQTHFTEEEIAICSEAVNNNTVSKLDSDLLDHLNKCSKCREEVLFTSEIMESVDENTLDIINNRNNKFIRYALIFGSIAASIIVILYTLVNTDNNYQQIVDNLDSDVQTSKVQTKTDSNIIKADKYIAPKKEIREVKKKKSISFKESKELEKLVERYKSDSDRSVSNSKYQSEILFTSNQKIVLNIGNTEKEEFTIELFDSNNKKLKEFTTTKNKVNLSESLKYGNYYWKLLNEDFDLIFCGKIKIRK
ncbi:MAG: hypothetical protein N4A49_02275 [Marinifilaceae bacterium]|jgi:hypothetical protein|nr:hypothetical protein [Marinifilaceae bacterium]